MLYTIQYHTYQVGINIYIYVYHQSETISTFSTWSSFECLFQGDVRSFVHSFRREGYCWFEWLNIALYPPSPWSVQHNPLPYIPITITTHGPSKHNPLLNSTFHNALHYNNGRNCLSMSITHALHQLSTFPYSSTAMMMLITSLKSNQVKSGQVMRNPSDRVFWIEYFNSHTTLSHQGSFLTTFYHS